MNEILKDTFKVIELYQIDITLDDIIKHWSEEHRNFHTLEHLTDVLDQIQNRKDEFRLPDYYSLIIAAFFHDIVYDPQRNDNEEKSVKFFNSRLPKPSLKMLSLNSDMIFNNVKDIIIDTKKHSAKKGVKKIFNDIDCSILTRKFIDLVRWEEQIYEEYKFVGWDKYFENRMKFLKTILPKYKKNKVELNKLIQFLEYRNAHNIFN